MTEEREKLIENIIAKANRMNIDRKWLITKDEIVNHPGIKCSFDIGFLNGYMLCKTEIMNMVEQLFEYYDKESEASLKHEDTSAEVAWFEGNRDCAEIILRNIKEERYEIHDNKLRSQSS